MPARATVLAVAVLAPLALLASACAGPTLAQRQEAAQGALAALREARFEDAQKGADEVITRDRQNPYAHLAAAIARFRTTMHQLATDVPSAAMSVLVGGFNHRYMRFALEQADNELALVDRDLAQAARFSDLTLDLCLACWQVDWNRNGRVDERDERLLEIELDADGRELPEGDPRRRPTFRFDHGDVLWARAFVSFQRAALDILLAYRWTEMDKIVGFLGRGEGGTITIRMEQPQRIREARRLVLAGLDLADQARRAYLAETDDEREWLPNPRQRSHPLPLPVDDALYGTWEQILGDLRRLVSGEEGLSVAELAQLGDHQWEHPPGGYLDLGGMLAHPKDIVIDLGELSRGNPFEAEHPEPFLRTLLGDYYAPQMKPSPLLSRLGRMKNEVERGQESLERKLRYLLWLN